MRSTTNQPENLQELQDLFLDILEAKDLTILAHGNSYSRGPEHDIEVELPDGFQAFIKIRESQDDEYLIERYEGEENEPDDPDGRTRTTPLTNEGAEALRRELEEAEHFAKLAAQQRGIEEADREIAEGEEGQDYEDVADGFSRGIQ